MILKKCPSEEVLHILMDCFLKGQFACTNSWHRRPHCCTEQDKLLALEQGSPTLVLEIPALEEPFYLDGEPQNKPDQCL